MSAVEEQLRAEVSALKEVLAQLQGGEDQASQYRTAFGLQPAHARLLAVLVNTRRPIHTDALYAMVFEQPNGDGPLPGSVKIGVSTIRHRVAGYGAPERTIPAAFGTACYSLTPEFRAWLTAYLQPVEIAA